jgi:ketosteroid isomerase-like protein
VGTLRQVSETVTLLILISAPFKGAEAVRQDWAGFFSAMREIHLEQSDLEIISDGNLAFSHFAESVDVITNRGERVSAVLRTTHVYRKTHGEWLIVHEHKSVPAGHLHP